MGKTIRAGFFFVGIFLLLVSFTGCVTIDHPVTMDKPVSSASIVATQIPSTRTTPFDEETGENLFADLAKEKIREFSKNTSLVLKLRKIDHQPYGDLYWFDVAHTYLFIVNNNTGRVQAATQYEVGSKNQKEIIDIDQGYSIAESYTREKFPEFWNTSDSQGIRVLKKEVQDRGMDRQFNFEWWEIFYTSDKNALINTGIPGLNSVSVTVSPYTGHVIAYHEKYEPMITYGSPPVNLTPDLTEYDARKIADEKFAEMGVPVYSQETKGIVRLRISKDKENIPRLVWNFGKEWTEKDTRNYFATVSIDAHNGTIVNSIKSSCA